MNLLTCTCSCVYIKGGSNNRYFIKKTSNSEEKLYFGTLNLKKIIKSVVVNL